MSAFRSPTTAVAFDQGRPGEGSRWRTATREAHAGIGDSAWHWTELKEPAATRVDAAPARRSPIPIRSRGSTHPTPGQSHWQA